MNKREHKRNNPRHCKAHSGANENPGARAGATGAVSNGPVLKTQEYGKRYEAASALIDAIRECHPEESVPILAAALDSLTPEYPGVTFRSLMEEAECWAMLAGRNERKAYALQCFKAMRLSDRKAFLAYAHRWLT